VLVDEITSRMTDGDAGDENGKGSEHANDATGLSSASGKQPCTQRKESQPGKKEEALGRLLVILDVAFCHDPFDALLLVFPGFEREPPAAHEKDLKQHDEPPYADREELLRNQYHPQKRERGNQNGERNRKVNDCGMERVGQHG
jgi:hypothetical protein